MPSINCRAGWRMAVLATIRMQLLKPRPWGSLYLERVQYALHSLYEATCAG